MNRKFLGKNRFSIFILKRFFLYVKCYTFGGENDKM